MANARERRHGTNRRKTVIMRQSGCDWHGMIVNARKGTMAMRRIMANARERVQW